MSENKYVASKSAKDFLNKFSSGSTTSLSKTVSRLKKDNFSNEKSNFSNIIYTETNLMRGFKEGFKKYLF